MADLQVSKQEAAAEAGRHHDITATGFRYRFGLVLQRQTDHNKSSWAFPPSPPLDQWVEDKGGERRGYSPGFGVCEAFLSRISKPAHVPQLSSNLPSEVM